jgi:hypothetical protein
VAQLIVRCSCGSAALALVRALTDAPRAGLAATLLGTPSEQPSPWLLRALSVPLTPARAVLLAALCALAENGAGWVLRRELSAALRRARLPPASALAGAGMCAVVEVVGVVCHVEKQVWRASETWDWTADERA